MAKKIREIMSPAPVSLAATEPVSAAARAMKDHGIGTVFVLAGGKLTGPDDDVSQAGRLVRDRAVGRIPVVEDGAPVGIVSIGELALEKDPRGQSALCAAPPSA